VTALLHWRLREFYYGVALSKTSKSVQAQGLTYLSPAKLLSLERLTRKIDSARVDGLIVEFGIALGGSSIVIAKQMAPDRSYWGYDLFGTIPPPSERDDEKAHKRYEVIASGRSAGLAGHTYYGYEDDLYGKVKNSFAQYGLTVDDRRIRLIKGLFADTVSFEPEAAIALAHIDCDWHDPVAFCLDRIQPHLSRGGYIVLDDYNDHGGCRRATDAFVARHADLHLVTTTPHAILKRV
jgi:asparagine synthase (glutamine-hydrolysing)